MPLPFRHPIKRFARTVAVAVLAGLLCGCGASSSLDALDGGPGASGNGANGKLPGHVYLMWGLVGEVFSRGLDGLATKIERNGVAASVHSMIETGSVTETIIRNYRRDPASAPVMLLGHSSGADAVIAIAERLKAAKVPVALIFGFDPTPIAGRIPSNVEMFINLYQGTNLIGGGSAVPGTDFRGRMVNVDLREHREIVHITLDKSEVIHALVVDKVLGVAAAAAQKQAALAMAAAPPAKKPQARRAPDAGAAPAYMLPLTMKYVVPAKEPIALFDSAIAVVVKPDDTLDSIAARTNTPAWVIGQVNKVAQDEPPRAGQRLLVPQIVFSAANPATAGAMKPGLR